MKAGRELDALVAERIMGWRNCRVGKEQTAGGVHGFGERESYGFIRILFPHYSTNIAAAWEVAEHVRKTSLYDCFSVYSPTDESRQWFAHFVRKWHGRSGGLPPVYDGEPGDSAPHAICLAALKAVGVDVD